VRSHSVQVRLVFLVASSSSMLMYASIVSIVFPARKGLPCLCGRGIGRVLLV